MNLQDTHSYKFFKELETDFSAALKHNANEVPPEELWLAFARTHSEMLEMLTYAFYGEMKMKPSETSLMYQMKNGSLQCWFEALDTGKRYDELLRENQQLHAQIKALTEELESLDNCEMNPIC
jgi:hypothetical protein